MQRARAHEHAARLRRIVTGVTCALLATGLIVGCSATGRGSLAPGESAGTWVEFGPFEKPEMFAEEQALPGPVDISVPGEGVVHLDATELLPGHQVGKEFYAATYNEDEPIVIGVVSSWTPAEGRHPEGYATTVLGIAVTGTGGEPQLRTRTRVFLGEKHTAALAGTSDLGVAAVALEGPLLVDDPTVIRRTIGVDAARGTEVWWKEGGYPEYGQDTAKFFTVDSASGCVTAAEEYTVASGITVGTEPPAPQPGEGCLKAPIAP